MIFLLVFEALKLQVRLDTCKQGQVRYFKEEEQQLIVSGVSFQEASIDGEALIVPKGSCEKNGCSPTSSFSP